MTEQYNHFLQLAGSEKILLVIVNDGSVGTTIQEGIIHLQQQFPDLLFLENETNKGKGNALRKAVTAVTAKSYLLTDIDFPYRAESMLAVYKQVISTAVYIAAGSRNEVYYNKIGTGRQLLSKMLRFGIRSLFSISIDDTQCGLKGFSEKAKPVFLNCVTNRYLYDLEFIVRAHKEKELRIAAVPVQLREGIELRKMALHIILQEIKSFFNILKIRYS